LHYSWRSQIWAAGILGCLIALSTNQRIFNVLGNDGRKTETKAEATTETKTKTKTNLLGGIMPNINPIFARDLSDRNKVEFKVAHQTFTARDGSDGRWYGHLKVNGRIKEDFSYASRRSMRRSIMDRIRAIYPGVDFVK